MDFRISITLHERPNILIYLLRFWAYRLIVKQTLKEKFLIYFDWR